MNTVLAIASLTCCFVTRPFVSSVLLPPPRQVGELMETAVSSRALLEQCSASLLAHQQALERMAAEGAERPTRPEIEARLSRHPTVEVMRDALQRTVALQEPTREAWASAIQERAKVAVLTALGYGLRPDGSVGLSRSFEADRATVESLRAALDGKASKWEVRGGRGGNGERVLRPR